MGATQNRPPHPPRGEGQAGGLRGHGEGHATPWPGVPVTPPSSWGGPQGRAPFVLPLWGDCPEAASPTQTPAVGAPRPQLPPEGSEEDTRLPALTERIP